MTDEFRQNNGLNNNLIIRDYMLQSLQPIERIRAAYPSLIFEPIINRLIHVEIPQGEEDAFERLKNQEAFLTIPALYGLYATEEALVQTNIAMFHNYPFASLTGNGVIIGFVDTGIEYTNKLFQHADHTTRIIRIWDQTLPGNSPSGYTYGTEYTAEAINQALISENPYEIVPTQDDVGHGTFLAGVAAGDDKTGTGEYRGGAPEALIAMVKLRPAKAYLKEYYFIEVDDDAYEENDFLTGVNYLVQMATEFQMPLIICIGMGDNAGAHDGSTIVEQYLDQISLIKNIVVVVAAGNEANSGHHFSGTLTEGAMQDIEISVSQEEVRGFIAYLWTNITDKVAVSIRSPIGQVIERVPVIPQEVTSYTFGLETTRITINYNYPNIQNGLQNTIIRFEKPTPGVWSVTVYGQEVTNGHYHMWLQRNEFITEETMFLRAEILMTIAIPSTAEYVMTVGAYDYIDQSIYVGSGRGPTVNYIAKPELIAPGVNVKGPLLGGGYTTYTGTSIAAAITASAATLLMEWAVIQGNLQNMNTRIARGIFIRGATRRRGIEYPNPIEGYGRLDLRSAIASL
ncbi:S8 family peptidase [Cellulosilyticum sp. I15G10I2]|uniref:S8 family peptidase n=1 Tax=Cellulosilyticum sp. I15G10I2 TaxID=1892843 RepID=UPI00085BC32A|nr:S8 family peptidase [Cellulosilyticum sp. I15G10I2]